MTESKRVIVTGAARGIGRAIALRLAQDERRQGQCARLLLADMLGDELESLAEELRAEGVDVCTVGGDMADPALPERIVSAANARFGGIDAVISNAGMAIPAPMLDYRLEDWDRVFAVNVRAAMLLGQAAHPGLKASRGCLVITTSISGSHATVPLGAYSASKAAALMLMRQFALEWGPAGIRVNAISPGMTQTPGTAVIYSNPGAKAKREARIPLRRVAQPEDMANAVSFLIGPDAAYVHGQDLVVDGGFGIGLMGGASMEHWQPNTAPARQ